MTFSRIPRLASTTLAVLLLAASCSDGPSGPDVPLNPAVVQSAAGDGQTAQVSTPVLVSPTVLVRDGDGEPLVGVTVWFVIIRGGGSVQRGITTTDSAGLASAGHWVLGPAEGTNEVEAKAGNHGTVRFLATATPAPPPGEPDPDAESEFDIEIRWVSGGGAAVNLAVANAVNRWRTVVIGDLPNVPITLPENQCFTGQPAIDQVVDDLLLFIEFVDIDGAGKVLGRAGPCVKRSGTDLPAVGRLQMDNADLAQLQQDGRLEDVVLHEIGHVLGIGTIWTDRGLLVGAGTQDPYFSGQLAIDAYYAMGGGGPGVPVEGTGGAGTRDSHWRESEFDDELMTGFVNSAPNPLSTVTIASLRDMGYIAQPAAADPYTLPHLATATVHEDALDLTQGEVLLRPKFEIDGRGRITRLPEY